MNEMSRLAIVLATLTGAIPPAGAQCTSEERQLLVTPDGMTLDGFGRAVVVDDGYAVVTADGEDAIGTAYAYRSNGTQWVPTQVIRPADAELLSRFGASAALNGTTLMIGDTFDDDLGISSGTVFVYERAGDDWSEVQRLNASDGDAFDNFGESLALTDDVAVVGSINAGDPAVDTGAAYVFRHDGDSWNEEQRLTVGTLDALDQFGWAVSRDGDHVAVSAVNDDDRGSDAGAVYLFRYDGDVWVERQKLLASDGAAGDFFGWRVVLSGTTLAVGAPQHDLPSDASGAVYLFEYDGTSWNEVQKLAPTDVGPFSNFGWSIGVDGDRMAIGGIGSRNGAGAVYLFQRDGTRWVEAHRLIDSRPPGGGFFSDNLGLSVDLDGAAVLGGAPFADGASESDAGSVSAFRVEELGFAALPEVVPAGGKLGLRACGGLSGADARVRLRELDGRPASATVGSGTFDADGTFQLSLPVPGGAAGTSVVLEAEGFWQPGVAGSSSTVTVTVE